MSKKPARWNSFIWGMPLILGACAYSPWIPNSRLNAIAVDLAAGREEKADERMRNVIREYPGQHTPRAFYASYLFSRLQYDSAAMEFQRANAIYRRKVVDVFDPFGTVLTANVVNGVLDNWTCTYFEWVENELFAGRAEEALRIIRKERFTSLSSFDEVRMTLLEIRATRRAMDSSGTDSLLFVLERHRSGLPPPRANDGRDVLYLDLHEVTGKGEYLDSAAFYFTQTTDSLGLAYYAARRAALLKDTAFPERLADFRAAMKGSVAFLRDSVGFTNLHKRGDYYRL